MASIGSAFGLGTLLILLGASLFVLPGIWVMVKIAFAEYLLVLRGLTPLAALKQSFQLTRGRFLLVLGCVMTVLLPVWMLEVWIAAQLFADETRRYCRRCCWMAWSACCTAADHHAVPLLHALQRTAGKAVGAQLRRRSAGPAVRRRRPARLAWPFRRTHHGRTEPQHPFPHFLGSNRFDEAVAFYDQVSATLGCKRILEHPGAVAWGREYPEFWVQRPFDGGTASVGNGTMWASSPPIRLPWMPSTEPPSPPARSMKAPWTTAGVWRALLRLLRP